jgi:hypothetical protein
MMASIGGFFLKKSSIFSGMSIAMAIRENNPVENMNVTRYFLMMYLSIIVSLNFDMVYLTGTSIIKYYANYIYSLWVITGSISFFQLSKSP